MNKFAYKFKFAEDVKLLVVAFLIVSLFSSTFYFKYAYGEAETLTVTVQSTLSFSASTDNFGNLTPGTAKFATTTLSVSTNNADGWNITFYGDDQGTSNEVCDLDSDASVGMTDQTEWVNAAATTTASNAVRISSFDNSGDVLAFRVMTASGSAPFRAATWWGSADEYTDNANTLWAGISSSTVSRQIGNAGAGSYSSSSHLNTVLYYLDVPSSQQTGAYSCPLTYTATAN